MSDLENKTSEETPKKRPYNLREKKEKKAAYIEYANGDRQYAE